MNGNVFQEPRNQHEWSSVADELEQKWDYPNCIGAVDGKHVHIICPPNSGSDYYNYKGHYSIVLLGIVDANYCFLYANVGCQGKMSDGGIFKHCSFGRRLNDSMLPLPDSKPLPGRSVPVPYVLVADDAFPLTTNIMKPFSVDLANGSPKRVFNYRLSRCRRLVENAFGLMASVFRVFRRPIELKVETVVMLVMCCVYLHNFLRKRAASRHVYATKGTLDSENPLTGDLILGSWREVTKNDTGMQPLHSVPRKPSKDAQQIREEFMNYFMSDTGSVPWQMQYA